MKGLQAAAYARRKKILAVAGLLAAFILLEGCYYMQAIRGHSDLMSRRRPLAELLDDTTTAPDLKRRLELVSEAREFAVATLLLPENDSYRSYADLEREFVVWNVFAAPEFSLEPRRWCYPVAGCVAYRGYFREADARKLAERLERDGYDVAVGGVSAYSTLGRFADPLLNTMMRWSDLQLVSTMFHELAHQKLYVKGDTAFNESFATAVAEFGIRRWLAARGEEDRLDSYVERQDLRRRMMSLVDAARKALGELYAQDIDVAMKRERKTTILNRLSSDAEKMLLGTGSGNWLAAPLNNARLISLSLYEGQLDGFRAILADCEHSLACFYAETERVAKMKASARAAYMATR